MHVQAGADSLADTCEKALKRMGVRKRRGRVTTVREGRNSRHRFVGKRFELYDKQTGETVEEDTDLVIWTAGVPPYVAELLLQPVSAKAGLLYMAGCVLASFARRSSCCRSGC